MAERPAGARGFPDVYWTDNYDEPEAMDGIGNAAEHAAYLRATFAVAYGRVHSVSDFGFGLGHLFEHVLRVFEPYRAFGLEPSAHAYATVRQREIAPPKTKLVLEHVDLATWCARPDHPARRADLGLCTSVMQYLDDDELEAVIPVLARRVKWLYLTVPTTTEMAWQTRQEGFTDAYAYSRPRDWYRDLLEDHFTMVGARLLESHDTMDEEDSPFTDHLFRGWS